MSKWRTGSTAPITGEPFIGTGLNGFNTLVLMWWTNEYKSEDGYNDRDEGWRGMVLNNGKIISTVLNCAAPAQWHSILPELPSDAE